MVSVLHLVAMASLTSTPKQCVCVCMRMGACGLNTNLEFRGCGFGVWGVGFGVQGTPHTQPSAFKLFAWCSVGNEGSP